MKAWDESTKLTFSIIRYLIVSISIAAIGGLLVLIYQSYQESIDPKRVYGRWLEVGTSANTRYTIEFNETGVFRNNRLVTTKFEFNGNKIFIATGSGEYIYQLSNVKDIPRLRRLQPNSPTQHFVKQGYEHLINLEGGGMANKRRSAISDHFN